MMRWSVGALVLGSVVAAGRGGKVPAYRPQTGAKGRLRIVGSDTMRPLVSTWKDAFRKHHRRAFILHEGRGSETAMAALTEGMADIATMARPCTSAETEQFRAKYGYRPVQIPVAETSVAVFVHKDNPVGRRGLNVTELDALFSRDRKRGGTPVTSWKDLKVSGALATSLPTVYTRNPGSGTWHLVRQQVLQGGDFAESAAPLAGSEAVVLAVAGNPAGIGFAGCTFDHGDVVPVPLLVGGNRVAPDDTDRYPLHARLFITVNLPPNGALSPLQAAFIRFVLSEDGRQLVRDQGFRPVPADQAQEVLAKLEPMQGT